MKKRATGLLLGLAGVSLLTVGFSAWIITGLAEQTTIDNVQVSVGQTENNLFTFVSAEATEGKIRFDALKGDKEGIIQNSSETDFEDMDFTIKIVIGNALVEGGTDFKAEFKKTKLSIDFTSSKATEFSEALTNEYIVSPFGATGKDEIAFTTFTSGTMSTENHSSAATYIKKEVTAKAVESTTNLELTIKYGFAWGAFFKNENPSATNDRTDATKFIPVLEKLNKDFNDSTFTLTINHVNA